MLSENDISNFWKSYNTFQESLNKNKNNENYIIYEGPPFATGKPHYGHILSGLIKDTITRYQELKQKYVPRIAGWDCHGLPIEFQIDQLYGIKTIDDVLKIGISDYNQKCKNIVLDCVDSWEETINAIGRWVDYKNAYTTMSLSYMNSVCWVFKQLFSKNRIYLGSRIMPYSLACATPLSNFETSSNYKEVQDLTVVFKLKIKKFKNYDNLYILVWTTTPWTIAANYCLCVNPNIEYAIINFQDNNYIVASNLINNHFKSDFLIVESFLGSELNNIHYYPAFTYNKYVKDYIIVTDNFVSDTDGTGIVHMAPAFGIDDNRICIEQNIIKKEDKLFDHLDKNGYINIDELRKMFYKHFEKSKELDFNTFTIIELKKNNNFFSNKQITHNYPYCWRSNTPLIYKAVDACFIKVEDMQDKLVELNQKINWRNDNVKSRFDQWLQNARDWCVSRNRFWGTPILLFVSEDNDIICVESSLELEKLARLEKNSITDLHCDKIDHIILNINGKEYKRVPFVFDCWFESGSMPYAQLDIVNLISKSKNGIQLNENGYPFIFTDKEHKILPADFISEGLDQTRGWFYTLLVISASLFDTIPFKNVIVNGLILAEDGKKMSKSLKNYTDPMEIIKLHGSDALRLYLLSSIALKGEPLKFIDKNVFDVKKNILIPLGSSFNFLTEYLTLYIHKNGTSPIINISELKIINPINLWIIKKYGSIRKQYYKYMDDYNIKNSIELLYEIVENLNNIYINISRDQLKGKKTLSECIESLNVLYYILYNIIIDFRPVMPFFCEIQYQKLLKSEKSIHLLDIEDYIKLTPKQNNIAFNFDIICDLISNITNLRGIHNITGKKPIKQIKLYFDHEAYKYFNQYCLEYISYIINKCNIMDILIIDSNTININKEVKLNKKVFFTKFKNQSSIFMELNKLNSDQLYLLIDTYYFDIFLDKTLFDIKYILDNPNLIVTNANIKNSNILIELDKTYDEEVDKLYYYRTIVRNIQKLRLEAGLHPWDKINSYWLGNPKYELDKKYIEESTGIKFEQYQEQLKLIDAECFELKLILSHE